MKFWEHMHIAYAYKEREEIRNRATMLLRSQFGKRRALVAAGVV